MWQLGYGLIRVPLAIPPAFWCAREQMVDHTRIRWDLLLYHYTVRTTVGVPLWRALYSSSRVLCAPRLSVVHAQNMVKNKGDYRCPAAAARASCRARARAAPHHAASGLCERHARHCPLRRFGSGVRSAADSGRARASQARAARTGGVGRAMRRGPRRRSSSRRTGRVRAAPSCPQPHTHTHCARSRAAAAAAQSTRR